MSSVDKDLSRLYREVEMGGARERGEAEKEIMRLLMRKHGHNFSFEFRFKEDGSGHFRKSLPSLSSWKKGGFTVYGVFPVEKVDDCDRESGIRRWKRELLSRGERVKKDAIELELEQEGIFSKEDLESHDIFSLVD